MSLKSTPAFKIRKIRYVRADTPEQIYKQIRQGAGTSRHDYNQKK